MDSVRSESDPDGDEAAIGAWVAALEKRHLAQLRFSDVTRALRALSSTYVQRRHRLTQGAALSGGGKRAAFALTYGPMHFLVIREILRSLPPPADRLDTVVDLGCGTGAAGAAWALALGRRPHVLGVDRHKWALAEAVWTYRHFGLRARSLQSDAIRTPLPTRRTGIVAGWLMNELSDESRSAVLDRLLTANRRGATLLIVEPIARSVSPWWDMWSEIFAGEGGRADEWRFPLALPEIVRRLDRAAGLSHDELTARSLWLPAPDRG
jgi:hypothetical protein